jgi:hypothetical protein
VPSTFATSPPRMLVLRYILANNAFALTFFSNFFNLMVTFYWITLLSSVSSNHSFTSDSTMKSATLRTLYLSYTLTLKMVTEIFDETLENLQHSMRRNSESWHHALIILWFMRNRHAPPSIQHKFAMRTCIQCVRIPIDMWLQH